VQSGQGNFEVLLRFNELAADYIREKRWHESQELKELPDGGVELRLRLSSLAEVERWVLGWAGNAVVLQPPELAQSVALAARKILQSVPQTQPGTQSA
jgi:proteasome accessory factor B